MKLVDFGLGTNYISLCIFINILVYLNYNCIKVLRSKIRPECLKQGWGTLILEGHSPAEFSSNPEKPWKIPNCILKTLISCFRCVWLGLELNSAGHRPSRINVPHPWFKVWLLLCVAGWTLFWWRSVALWFPLCILLSVRVQQHQWVKHQRDFTLLTCCNTVDLYKSTTESLWLTYNTSRSAAYSHFKNTTVWCFHSNSFEWMVTRLLWWWRDLCEIKHKDFE